MIDLEKTKKLYKEYIDNYNPENPKIALKIDHVFRTAKKARKIAKSLNLTKEDVELAELIGMLHDIGRFEQLKQYDTYNDRESFNHAEYGAKILFEDGLIEKFVEDRQYDRIIYLAIINHNRYSIENRLNNRELMHCKIIRDADKWDIFYVDAIESKEAIWGSSNPIFENEISPEAMDEFLKVGQISFSNVKTIEDSFLIKIGLVFGIYFDYTLENVVKENYLELIRNRYEFKNEKLNKQLDLAYDKIYKYINDRLKNVGV